MVDKDLLYGNPFLAAMENYLRGGGTLNTVNSHRLNAIQDVVKQLIAEDDKEYADQFLQILSNRVLTFFSHKVLSARDETDSRDTSYIYRFAILPSVTDQDFILILERAALLWEEVNGNAVLILPKLAPKDPIANKTSTTRLTEPEKLARCVEFITALIECLKDPRVVMIPSRDGLKIKIPNEVQENVLQLATVRDEFSIIGLLQMFPGGHGTWEEMYYQVLRVVDQLDLHPKVLFNAPLQDFSSQPDVDDEVFLMVLDEALKGTEEDLAFELTRHSTDAPLQSLPVPAGDGWTPSFRYSEDAWWDN